MASPIVNVTIVPCVDTFLYAPVYLALIDVWRRYRNGASKEPGIFDLPDVDGQAVKITFAAAPEGDQAVVERLLRSNAADLTVGICDPLTVLTSNLADRRQDPDSWSPLLAIPAILIDRISLAVFARRPRPLRRHYPRDRVLHEVIEQLRAESVNPKGIFQSFDPDRVLACDYWDRGETTRFLAQRYLELQTPAHSPTAAEYRASGDAASISSLRLLEKTSDIAITHAPWIVNDDHRRRLEVFCRECFPAIQFPFTCLVVRRQLNADQNKFLGVLLKSLYVAVTLLYRQPDAAVHLLVKWATPFRQYGVSNPMRVQELASRAINHLLKIGCYAEPLSTERVAWEYAVSLDTRWTELSEGTRTWYDVAWDVLDKTLRESPIASQQRTTAFAREVEEAYRDLVIMSAE